MNKLVIIVNGKGGVGKDTLCDAFSTEFKCSHISAITPIKSLAKLSIGWDNDKSLAGRKLLSDLKQACIEYNELPTVYLLKEYLRFRESDKQVLFVDIREATEIQKFKKLVTELKGTVVTLLITRDVIDFAEYGNDSDDLVSEYQYDVVYANNLPEEESKQAFINLMKAHYFN